MNTELILGILTALFGGANIWQFVNIRAIKSKATEEARSVKIDNDKSSLDLLQSYRKETDSQILELTKRLMDTQDRQLSMKEEIADLKILLRQSQSYECIDHNCVKRIKKQKN